MNLRQINSLEVEGKCGPWSEDYEVYYFALLSGNVTSVTERTAIVNIIYGKYGSGGDLYYIPDEGSTLIVNNDFSSNDIQYIDISFDGLRPRSERFELDGGLSVGCNILYFINDTSNGIYKFVNLTQKMSNVIPITYDRLFSLRRSGMLIPGMQYRITDFVTTVMRNDAFTSASNPFDIIVTASSSNTLNEDAKAALHDGDRYFANCDIDSWELKYCIDNDTNRFDWVNPNPAEGKGVIYYMKDDLGNECPYDFKNIMMYDREMSTMVYTFTAKPGQDASVGLIGTGGEPRNNVIRALHIQTPAGNIQSLNYIIFRGFPCNDNYIGENCQNIFFGSYCNKNIIGDNCSGITFVSGEYNELGNDCSGILFENGCHHNTLGFNCSNITFGMECTFNTLGFECSNITFVEACEFNKFGNKCNVIDFGVNTSFNTFGDRCTRQSMANKAQYNTFGDDCGGNIFGEFCFYNRLGNGCISIAMGYGCWNNTFENDCSNIAFMSGPEMHGNYYRYNKFGQGCNNIELNAIDIIPPGSVQPNGIKPTLWVQNYNFINILYDGNVVPITAERGLTYETKIARDNEGVIRIYNDFLTTNVTYNKLLELRNSNKLIPGMQYRITDYGVGQYRTDILLTAGHQFDIIVTASSTNTLNEDAKAALHDGDIYFANCDIDSWELKYCIDNDNTRFAWASELGSGVIYYMKDNLGNECPYDFKNIMLSNPLDTSDDTWYYTFSNLPGQIGNTTGGIEDDSVVGYSTNNVIKHNYDSKRKIYSLPFIIFRGFNSSSNFFDVGCGNIVDAGSGNKFGRNCFNIVGGGGNTFGNSCYDITFGNLCTFNTFGNNCSTLTFGDDCFGNKFGSDFHDNVLGTRCFNNTFGDRCRYNIFGSNCVQNTLGNDSQHNTFGHDFQNNTFGDICQYNTFGDGCQYNTFKNNCQYNTFGGNCSYNTFGNNCGGYGKSGFYGGIGGVLRDDGGSEYYNYNILGDNCSYNMLGNDCHGNVLGNDCSYNIFGNKCGMFSAGQDDNFAIGCIRNNVLGNNCSHNTFGNECYGHRLGHNCINITFEKLCKFIFLSSTSNDISAQLSHFKNITFNTDCSFITLLEDTPVDETSPLYAQNYVFMNVVSGGSTSLQEYTVNRGNAYYTKVARASNGTLRTYCEEDI